VWGALEPDAAWRAIAKPTLARQFGAVGLGVWLVLVLLPTQQLVRGSSIPLTLAALPMAGMILAGLAARRWIDRWPSVAGVVLGGSQGVVLGYELTERNVAAECMCAHASHVGWLVLGAVVFGALCAGVGALAVGTEGRIHAAERRRELFVLPSTLRDEAIWSACAAAIAYGRDLHEPALVLLLVSAVTFVAMVVVRRRREGFLRAVAAGEVDGWSYEPAGGGLLLRETPALDGPYRGLPTWAVVARVAPR
jgi:hypothetical protein